MASIDDYRSFLDQVRKASAAGDESAWAMQRALRAAPDDPRANRNYTRWHLEKAQDANGDDILTFRWAAGTTVIMR